MWAKISSTLGLCLLLFSCGTDGESTHSYATFFFPYDEEAKIYVYRDHVQGMDEKHYRVYGVTDSHGKHIVVENYASDGRLKEATNYNWDSLTVMDHMVVDRDKKKTQAILMKNTAFPRKTGEQTWFSSKFPGFLDSTIIVNELKRSFEQAVPSRMDVLGKSCNVISFRDTIRLTAVNLYSKKENELSSAFISYYGEGIGLVRMHDLDMRTDYRLERILSQAEWLKLIKR